MQGNDHLVLFKIASFVKDRPFEFWGGVFKDCPEDFEKIPSAP